jgi:hypothetical protein
VSHHVGSDLCYWIVTDSGQVVSKTSVEHVTREDYLSEDTNVLLPKFDRGGIFSRGSTGIPPHLDHTPWYCPPEGGV